MTCSVRSLRAIPTLRSLRAIPTPQMSNQSRESSREAERSSLDAQRQCQVRAELSVLGFSGCAWISLIVQYLAPVIALVGSRGNARKTTLLNSLLQNCVDVSTGFVDRHLAAHPQLDPFSNLQGVRLTTAQIQQRIDSAKSELGVPGLPEGRDDDFLLPVFTKKEGWGCVSTCVPTYIRYAPVYGIYIVSLKENEIWQGTAATSTADRRMLTRLTMVYQHRDPTQYRDLTLEGTSRHPQETVWSTQPLAITLYGPFPLLKEGAVLVDTADTNHLYRGPHDVLGLPIPEQHRRLNDEQLQKFRDHVPQVTQLWIMSLDHCDVKTGRDWVTAHHPYTSVARESIIHMMVIHTMVNDIDRHWTLADIRHKRQRQCAIDFGLASSNIQQQLSPVCLVSLSPHHWWSQDDTTTPPADVDKQTILHWSFGPNFWRPSPSAPSKRQRVQ
jgi:hypothetical protein